MDPRRFLRWVAGALVRDGGRGGGGCGWPGIRMAGGICGLFSCAERVLAGIFPSAERCPWESNPWEGSNEGRPCLGEHPGVPREQRTSQVEAGEGGVGEQPVGQARPADRPDGIVWGGDRGAGRREGGGGASGAEGAWVVTVSMSCLVCARGGMRRDGDWGSPGVGRAHRTCSMSPPTQVNNTEAAMTPGMPTEH